MKNKVDKTAGHLRVLIEKVRAYDDEFRKGNPIGNTHTEMVQAANAAEAFLNKKTTK